MFDVRCELLAASLHDAARKLHGMKRFSRVLSPLFLLCLPLGADGVEGAVPFWHQGGEGPDGTLRQMAPRWEGSIQFGMRFGGANR